MSLNSALWVFFTLALASCLSGFNRTFLLMPFIPKIYLSISVSQFIVVASYLNLQLAFLLSGESFSPVNALDSPASLYSWLIALPSSGLNLRKKTSTER
jgi:hypothetical protein